MAASGFTKMFLAYESRRFFVSLCLATANNTWGLSAVKIKLAFGFFPPVERANKNELKTREGV